MFPVRFRDKQAGVGPTTAASDINKQSWTEWRDVAARGERARDIERATVLRDEPRLVEQPWGRALDGC